MLDEKIIHDLAIAYAGAAACNYMNERSSENKNYIPEDVMSNMVNDYFCAVHSFSSFSDEFISTLTDSCK